MTTQTSSPEKAELDTFIPDESNMILLPSGRRVPFPRTSWRTEKKIMDQVGQLMESVPELQQIDFSNMGSGEVVRLFRSVAMKAPDHITTIASLVTGQSEDSINDDWAAEDIAHVLFPFFSRKLSLILEPLSAEDEETTN